MSGMAVGQVWEAPLGKEMVLWRVSWVGKKKARLKAVLDYGWATATVTIEQWVASADTHLHTDVGRSATASSDPVAPEKALPCVGNET